MHHGKSKGTHTLSFLSDILNVIARSVCVLMGESKFKSIAFEMKVATSGKSNLGRRFLAKEVYLSFHRHCDQGE